MSPVYFVTYLSGSDPTGDMGALNISEGTGKSSMPDRVRFFEIAMGSIRECQAILEVESELFTASQKDLLDHLAASAYKLIKHSRR